MSGNTDCVYRREYRGRVKAVILDWSGTTVDAYVMAPAVVFVEVFKKQGVEISMLEARGPMGLRKDLHIKALTEIPEIRERWKSVKGKYPDQALVIAGDNDQWTDGNPGVTKATEAAKAVNAKVVIPTFKDTTDRPTDFNDLRLEGLNIVREQLEKGPSTSDTEADTETDSHTKTAYDFGPIPHGYTCRDDGVSQIPDDPEKPGLPGDGFTLFGRVHIEPHRHGDNSGLFIYVK